MKKPSLFIGSSSEGIEFARAIRGRLNNDAEITLWEDDFFRLGKTFIETLLDSAFRFDFAILVLTSDDLINSRNSENFGPRDNVIFELGLFMGILGRSRTFIVHPSDPKLKIPTDLSGVATAKYLWPREDKSQASAVGPACDTIRNIINDLGFSEGKTQKKLEGVAAEQLEQGKNIDALSFIISHFLPKFELEHLKNLEKNNDFPYQMQANFNREIRHLWELHLIRKKKEEFSITNMPQSGNLKDFFEITEGGKYLLKISDRFDNKSHN
ncbi:MAG: TIR domain-containing protein [Ferruginibacter sp.]